MGKYKILLDNFKNTFDDSVKLAQFEHYYDDIKSIVFEYGYDNDMSELIGYLSKRYTNEIMEFLFEKYVECEDWHIKENILHCVRCLLHESKRKPENMDNVYAILRMAIDENRYEEVVLAIIEELRDKVSLQILIDSINSDYFEMGEGLTDIYMDYALKVQKELEEELAELEDETADK